MLTAYIIILAAALVLCFLSEEIKTNRWIPLLIMGVGLVLIAGLKGRGVSVDEKYYREFYEHTLLFPMLFRNPVLFFSVDRAEPLFFVISSLCKTFLPASIGYQSVIFIFALLAVSIKLKCIDDYTEFAFLTLFLYISHTFFIQEIIQIRAGLATAIAFYSFRHIIDRNFPKFTLIMLVAIFFHYSAILFFPFYFVSTKKINPWLYVAIVAVPYLMLVSGWDCLSLLKKFDLGVYSDKLEHYEKDQVYHVHTIDRFNMTLLAQLLISGVLLFFRKELAEKTPYGILFLKINLVSIAMFYLCFPVPVFAFRVWGMMNIVQIFLFPYLAYFIRPRWIPDLIVILLGIGLFYSLAAQSHLRAFSFITF